MGEEVDVAGSKNEATAELKRILPQPSLSMTTCLGPLSGGQIVPSHQM